MITLKSDVLPAFILTAIVAILNKVFYWQIEKLPDKFLVWAIITAICVLLIMSFFRCNQLRTKGRVIIVAASGSFLFLAFLLAWLYGNFIWIPLPPQYQLCGEIGFYIFFAAGGVLMYPISLDFIIGKLPLRFYRATTAVFKWKS